MGLYFVSCWNPDREELMLQKLFKTLWFSKVLLLYGHGGKYQT